MLQPPVKVRGAGDRTATLRFTLQSFALRFTDRQTGFVTNFKPNSEILLSLLKVKVLLSNVITCVVLHTSILITCCLFLSKD